MANGFQGLGEGLERGFRIGNMLEESQQRREDREYQKEDREYQRRQQDTQFELSQMQLETFKDSKKREELRRSNDAVLYGLREMLNNADAYTKHLKDNPKKALELQKHLQRSGNFAFGDTGKAGKTDMIDLVPRGQNESGEPLFGVAVKNEKGKPSGITQNRGSMADGDPEQLFTLDDIGRGVSAINVKISQYEADQVALGDNSYLDMQRSSEVLQSQRAYKEGQLKDERKYKDDTAKTKFGYDKELRGITARGKANSKRVNPKEIGEDAEGNKIFGVYDEPTNSFIPVNGIGAKEELPPEQERALSIEDLQSKGIPKQKSTYFGLGDDQYSEDQINAETGRRRLGGGKGIGQPSATPTSAAPQANQGRSVGDKWVNPKGQPMIFTEDGPKVLVKKEQGQPKPVAQKEQPQPASKKGIGQPPSKAVQAPKQKEQLITNASLLIDKLTADAKAKNINVMERPTILKMGRKNTVDRPDIVKQIHHIQDLVDDLKQQARPNKFGKASDTAQKEAEAELAKILMEYGA